MLKKFIAVLLITSMPTVASAGIMADLNSMFMSNSTAPTSISTRDMNGFFGGNFSMRSPIQSVNIVTFDPPRLDAGCGGVDLFMGSFTFINSQQLVTLFRAVAANAVGLAFKAAIDAISPSLGKLMTEFQTLLQKMNNLAKNSCNMAHLLTDSYDKQITSALSGDAATAGIMANNNTDWTSVLGTYMASGVAYLNTVGASNPKAGNGNLKAILAAGNANNLGMAGFPNTDGSADDATNPNSLNNRVLLSLIGFESNAISCFVASQNGSPNTTAPAPAAPNLTQMNCSGATLLTLDSFAKGGGPGSANPSGTFNLWLCLNPSDPNQPCTQMQTQPFNYVGITGYINNMLFGVGDNSTYPDPASIVGMLNSGQSVQLTATQIGFLHQTGVPFIGLLTKTSDPGVRSSIAANLQPLITSCMLAKFGESLYQSLNGINNVVGFEITATTKEHISDLRNDYLSEQRLCNERGAVMRMAQQLDIAARLSTKQIK